MKNLIAIEKNKKPLDKNTKTFIRKNIYNSKRQLLSSAVLNRRKQEIMCSILRLFPQRPQFKR
jgi:hypothetical protein